MRRLLALGIALALCLTPAWADNTGTHGWSPLGEPALGPDFAHLPTVNPNAPMGGTLRLGRVETFDSTNTLNYRGSTPRDIRLIYDRLVVEAPDEPASYYGLLAETLSVADDLMSVTFRLRPEARWHDGEPVTADDVAFTFETLKVQGAPFYRQVLRNISVAAVDARTVRFENGGGPDREFVALVGTLPIHPKHHWKSIGVDSSGEAIPLGSGPYRVTRVDPGRTLVLERAEDYWARDLAINAGRWNFDRLEFDYYRDNTVALEAFKGGEFDARIEGNANLWANGYQGQRLRDGEIVQTVFTTDMPQQVQTLVFNQRRAPFNDIRVREALALAYDETFTIKSLFNGLVEPMRSVFGSSELADASQSLPTGLTMRERIAKASDLLDGAGFTVRDGQRINPQTDAPWRIRMVYMAPSLDRVMGPYARNLERLGIDLEYRALEPATGARTLLDKDFDMTALSWGPSALPGTAEALLWGSALADQPGSYALSGIKNADLDAAIATMSAARTQTDLIPAARAFDRILRETHAIVPLWQSSTVRIAHDRRLAFPDAGGIVPGLIDTWWQTAKETQ